MEAFGRIFELSCASTNTHTKTHTHTHRFFARAHITTVQVVEQKGLLSTCNANGRIAQVPDMHALQKQRRCRCIPGRIDTSACFSSGEQGGTEVLER